jgi:hypothetical protein
MLTVQNREAIQHTAMLTARLVESRQLQALAELASDTEDVRRYTANSNMLLAVADVIRHDAQLEPVRIVGIPASYAVIQVRNGL